MTLDILLALLAFAFVTSITPGPNNIMLMTSGVNFGFRRTLPHMLGVGLGFVLMVALVGLGLAGVFKAEPRAELVLKAVSTAYILWLAWKIAGAAAPRAGAAAGKPFSFVQAAGFQWVNPKAWAMALSATASYAPGQTAQEMVLVALIFGAVNLPSVSVWVVMGQGLRHLLTKPQWLRAFNWTMALLLLASQWAVLRL
ncbi:LysE family translocator [Pseudorhodobacter sp. E13]|uniref:LysE family translocator n=1 Tax=Pseudorhodobacter sp. E13 TaxID=2487931 RepID=UPI000F8EDE96|nr:LysE family translocator [Pseudorhodobacter sp. E13]RUS60638.1 LysE family translocator [Pseudorhodobacter sp. E13]